MAVAWASTNPYGRALQPPSLVTPMFNRWVLISSLVHLPAFLVLLQVHLSSSSRHAYNPIRLSYLWVPSMAIGTLSMGYSKLVKMKVSKDYIEAWERLWFGLVLEAACSCRHTFLRNGGSCAILVCKKDQHCIWQAVLAVVLWYAASCTHQVCRMSFGCFQD